MPRYVYVTLYADTTDDKQTREIMFLFFHTNYEPQKHKTTTIEGDVWWATDC